MHVELIVKSCHPHVGVSKVIVAFLGNVRLAVCLCCSCEMITLAPMSDDLVIGIKFIRRFALGFGQFKRNSRTL